MTPDPLAVSIKTLFAEGQPTVLYRIAKKRYANLSGVGAAVSPGRWNLPDQEAIYTSTEVGTCVCEKLVHQRKDEMPADLALMTIHLNGQWEDLASSWSAPPMPISETTRMMGDRRSRSTIVINGSVREAASSFPATFRRPAGREVLALVVPSLVVPVFNVVLYPQNRGFWSHVELKEVDTFAFDPRLFPEYVQD